jgi:hypothetical protein
MEPISAKIYETNFNKNGINSTKMGTNFRKNCADSVLTNCKSTLFLKLIDTSAFHL